MKFCRRLVSAFLLAGLSVASRVLAQDAIVQIGLVAGPAPYDLSGAGTAFSAATGVTWRPLHEVLLLEPGLGFFTYRTQGGTRSRWLFPELSIQAEAKLRRLRPYIGVGSGIGWERRSGMSRSEWTLHGVAGLRVDLGTAWGVRGELRLRAIDPWGSMVASWGFGVSRRLF